MSELETEQFMNSAYAIKKQEFVKEPTYDALVNDSNMSNNQNRRVPSIDNITDQPFDDDMNEDLKGVQQQRLLHGGQEFL